MALRYFAWLSNWEKQGTLAPFLLKMKQNKKQKKLDAFVNMILIYTPEESNVN